MSDQPRITHAAAQADGGSAEAATRLVFAWVRLACARLTDARADIDGLNVFPVPDADTGTNLMLTLDAARDALEAAEPASPLDALRAAAAGAFQGARGNSGVIVAELLRVAAETAGDLPGARGVAAVLSSGLDRAARAAYAAVGEPVEGTILSAARCAAEAASALTRDATDDRVPVRAVVQAAADAAWTALAASTDQLTALSDAGVVDAGAAGFCLLLDALVEVVCGVRPARPAFVLPRDGTVIGRAGAADAPGSPAFEVMYLLDAPDGALPALRASLQALGDSLVVVGGGGSWNVHVHVDDAGAAIEAAIEIGRPRRVRITSLRSPGVAPHQVGVVDAAGVALAADCARSSTRSVIAFAAGPGLAALFEQAGAVAVQDRGSAATTEAVVTSIRAAGATEVVLLPNDPAGIAAAERAAATLRADGRRTAVIPTRAQVQGLAAVAVAAAAADFDDEVVAMSAAAGHTRHGGVTVASRVAMTMAGPCREGDTLGIVDGDFAVVGGSLLEVAAEVVQRLLAGGGELVTLVTGADCPEELAPGLVERLERSRPDVEVCVYSGGQPRYPLLIGVE